MLHYYNLWKIGTMLPDLFVENSSAGFTLKWLPPTLLCDKVIKLFQRMHQDSVEVDVGAISGDLFYPVFILNISITCSASAASAVFVARLDVWDTLYLIRSA